MNSVTQDVSNPLFYKDVNFSIVGEMMVFRSHPNRIEWYYKNKSDKKNFIIYILDNWLFATYNGEKHLVKKGDVFIIPKKTDQFVYESIGTDCIPQFLVIEFWNEEKTLPFPCIYHNVSGKILELMCDIEKKYFSNSFCSKLEVKAMTYQLVRMLLEEYFMRNYYSKQYNRVKESIRYMDENYFRHDLSIEQIAQTSSLSVSHFRKLFKEVTGETPIQYLNQLKMKRAFDLLRQTNMPVSEIAETLGFENQYYFCNFFKKHAGISPLSYRNGK